MFLKPCKLWDKLPTSTGFLTGFLVAINRTTFTSDPHLGGRNGALRTDLQHSSDLKEVNLDLDMASWDEGREKGWFGTWKKMVGIK